MFHIDFTNAWPKVSRRPGYRDIMMYGGDVSGEALQNNPDNASELLITGH